MLNLSRRHREHGDRSYLDIEGFDRSQAAKNCLPRHISSLESKNHHAGDRNLAGASFKRSMPQKRAKETNNLAVCILTYQLKDKAAQQKHLANLRSNLQHRLEVAEAERNSQLVIMLQDEFRQFESNI